MKCLIFNRFLRRRISKSYARMTLRSSKLIHAIAGLNRIRSRFWMRCARVLLQPLESWTISFRTFTVSKILFHLVWPTNERLSLLGINILDCHFTMQLVRYLLDFCCCFISSNCYILYLYTFYWKIFILLFSSWNLVWSDCRTEETAERVLWNIPHQNEEYFKSISGKTFFAGKFSSNYSMFREL